MADEGEEKGTGFEDLFEDLDRFFAPGEQGERQARARGGRPADRPEGGGGGTGDADEEADLLPPGWKPDIEGLDLGASGAEPPARRDDEAPRDEEPDRDVPEPERESQPESPEPRAPEPTGEMTPEDWTRLKDALGEEPEEPAESYGFLDETPDVAAEEPAPEGPAAGEPEEDRVDEPDWLEPGTGQEITIEDMKKAPPEYRDLPVSPEEEALPSGSAEAAEPEAPPAAEPSMADVEAAADQLAEDFGETGEHPVFAEPEDVEEQLLADLEEPSGPRTVRVGATETLAGPTWEEPTSRPLSAEPSAPPGGPSRDMVAAVGTAAGLAVLAVIFLLIAKWLFAFVAGGVVLIGQAELYRTMHRKGHQPATALGLAVGGLTLAGAYLKGEQAMMFFVALGLFLCFLWYMAAPLKAREGLIGNVGSTLLGIIYVPFLAGYVFMLLAQRNSGRALMVTVIALAFVYDIAAYFFGSFWGRRPLAPTISPRKSWEGLLGGTAVTFAVTVALVPSILDYVSLAKALGLAIVVVVFAPLGDLVESLIKRDLGVKDMGSILPGHGGVLDRIDSVLLVAPAAFYYLRLIF